MRFEYGRFGLKSNPIGAQVKMDYKDIFLLGDVVDCYWDEIGGAVKLIVNHFNGNEWPIRPTALSVEVLEREYEPTGIKAKDQHNFVAFIDSAVRHNFK